MTLLTLVINLAAFSFIFLKVSSPRLIPLSRFGLMLSIVYIIFYFIKYNTKYLSRYKMEVSFIVLAVLWLVAGFPLPAIALIAFAIAGIYLSRQRNIIVDREKIVYPSLPPRHLLWKDVSNVILKDNILTIDKKDNHLLQTVITPHSSGIADEAAFNAFCLQQINEQQSL
ncbi:MAG: hypothetical protein ABIO05_05170 [Ferruginibacter sp.]